MDFETVGMVYVCDVRVVLRFDCSAQSVVLVWGGRGWHRGKGGIIRVGEIYS